MNFLKATDLLCYAISSPYLRLIGENTYTRDSELVFESLALSMQSNAMEEDRLRAKIARQGSYSSPFKFRILSCVLRRGVALCR